MSDPTIALALGAGGARGLAHIHALAAFDELGIKPKAISGTSIGSTMGAAYASGASAAEIEEFCRDRFRIGKDLMADIWKLRPESIAEFRESGGLRFGELNIERMTEVFLPKSLRETFEELEMPLAVVTTDYYNHCAKVFTNGPLKQAIAASSAVPAVFRPVVINGVVYVDGGLINPVPFDQLAGKADIIVGIDVCGGPVGTEGRRPTKVNALYASSQLMQRSITLSMAQHHQVDILLQPDVGRYRVLDFSKTLPILKHTHPFKDKLKKAITVEIEKRIKA